jgi:LacI family transcriptional regulator
LTARCEAIGVPVVLFNRLQDDEMLSGVASDNAAGGRKLAEFLVAGGHKKIAHIAGWDGASTQRDREAGFMQGLAEANMTLHSRAAGNFHADQAQAAARSLFDKEDRPDAVFVANDHMAFAVMDVLRYELGLRIPDDVSVVGYDDVTISAWPSYNLTTVRQPANRMVEETVKMMLSRIELPTTPARKVAIDGPLVVRGSARLPLGDEK